MPSSLGVYIEDGLIKYAKLQKDKDSIKVEAFNIEFYDNDPIPTLKKIITETNSSKIPICVNISDELYNYFEVFAKLEKKDIKKSVDLEFDLLCSEKGYNIKTLETRFILMKSTENAEKYKVLYIAANKSEINQKTKLFDGYKIHSLTPISTSITNLVEIDEKDNAIIVNIENETKITTIIEGQIYRVDMLQDGMGTILKEINKIENSDKKSYEVCKNITIYSQDSQVSEDDGEYIKDITRVLHKIVTETREILESSFIQIDKIYITGLGTAINNIDLFFQEYIQATKCEILKPFFAESGSIKVPIKEYIEVNSAIALALNGLGYLNRDLNFTVAPKVSLDADVGELIKQLFAYNGGTNEAKAPLDKDEKLLVRLIICTLVILFTYIAFSKYSINKIIEREEEVANAKIDAMIELEKIQKDVDKINTECEAYELSLESLRKLSEDVNESQTNRIIAKDSIPNFLNKMMFLIPQRVKVTSIKNGEGKKILIGAEAEKYEQLGYFMAALRTENVLLNVRTTTGIMQDDIVKITIEGELP